MKARFISPSTVLNSLYFRPGEWEHAFAIVLKPLEVIGHARGEREMRCEITVFEEEGDLEAAAPTRILSNVRVGSGAIFAQLARALDDGCILAGYIGQGEVTGHGTRPWIIEDLEPDVQERVADVWAEVVS